LLSDNRALLAVRFDGQEDQDLPVRVVGTGFQLVELLPGLPDRC